MGAIFFCSFISEEFFFEALRLQHKKFFFVVVFVAAKNNPLEKFFSRGLSGYIMT